LCCVFLRKGLLNYLPRLASNCISPNSWLSNS
jgi:hypothetical protein